MNVKAKKSLGQHFLKNDAICERVAGSLTLHGGYKRALEIGPGMGALTRHLLANEGFETSVVEIDRDSVAYLKKHFPALKERIYEEDFLQMNLVQVFGEQIAVVGNFPYNISSQILFRVLDYKEIVPEVVGMFQKEVAERIASGPGSRDYGITSVLLQAFYEIEYLFTVDRTEFIPPPKVQSGVIRLRRREKLTLDCDEKLFKTIVKTAFNQRRKTMRNSLKSLAGSGVDTGGDIFNKRPEQLGVDAFIELTHLFDQSKA